MSVQDKNAQTPKQKVCFVTIGATASFNALIEAMLSQTFLTTLKQHGYTELRLQHGLEGGALLKSFHASRTAEETPLKITGFDFNKKGLGAEMLAAKGSNGGSSEGVVISHAGSGSILDALRIAVPLIVVPNPSLLDNHQVELAEALAAQGYVVHGRLEDLATAVGESERLREKKNVWPPRDGEGDPAGKGLIGVMDDELGFVD
ncbi:N-acetylglucosaminyldiphosphodolichol N-acetylglucosaminyltransferase catalytic subunit alg13 [Lecanora helva]